MSAHAAHEHAHGRLISGVELDGGAAVHQRGHKRVHIRRVDGGNQAAHVVAVDDFAVLKVAGGQQGQHLLGLQKRLVLGGGGQRAGAHAGGHLRAAQLLGLDVQAIHGGQHLRAEHHHFAHFFRYDGHVRQLGQQRRAADAGAQHHRYDGAYAAHAGQLLINLAIRAHGGGAFVDAHAGAVQQRHHGRAGLEGHVQELEDFGSLGLAHRAAVNREILREEVHRTLLNGGISGDDARAFLVLAHQRKQLHKAAGIRELFHTLARGQLACFALFLEALFVAAEDGVTNFQHLLKVLRIVHFRSPFHAVMVFGQGQAGESPTCTPFI